MELTGFAGKLIGWIMLLITYFTIICGLFWVISYFLMEIVIAEVLKALKVWGVFVSWIWHRKEFKKWLNKREADSNSSAGNLLEQ